MSAIFIVGLIATLLTADWIFQMVRAKRMGTNLAAAPMPSLVDLAPDPGSFHSRGHTWVRIADDGRVRIGMDRFLRHAVGTPDRVELPANGKRIRKGETLLTLVKGDRKLNLTSPVSGDVVATNGSRSGMRTGEWTVCVEPLRIGAELKGLRIGEEAIAWIRQEAKRFRDFVVDGIAASPAMATLPDGGEPARGVLNHLPEEHWAEFEAEFLSETD
jgi:hypothetical protein